MKKEYIKPQVKKIEIDAQVLRMISREGFIQVFWEEFRQQQKKDPEVTREEIFDDLNLKYFNAFGSYRYSSYDSFRQRLGK